jgi:hypothetical protein
VKSTNPGPSDQFGHDVALDGDALAVSAELEDGSGIGISPADDNSAGNAGAVYIYQ